MAYNGRMVIRIKNQRSDNSALQTNNYLYATTHVRIGRTACREPKIYIEITDRRQLWTPLGYEYINDKNYRTFEMLN